MHIRGSKLFLCVRLCLAGSLSHSRLTYGQIHRSLGCVFYELTALKPAFNAFNIHGLVTKIRRHKMAPLPAGYSSEWGDLITL